MLDMFKDDATKQYSLSRVSAATVLLMQLIYAGYVVFTAKTLPDLQAGWAGLIIALYAANKTASVVATIKGAE